jgi:hypothetical protein
MDVHREFSNGDAIIAGSLGLVQLQDRLTNYGDAICR